PRSSFSSHSSQPHLHSFPTRRSSDLRHCPHGGSHHLPVEPVHGREVRPRAARPGIQVRARCRVPGGELPALPGRALLQEFRCQRSEEHTSELQSRENLVCRLLLEKKK